MARTMTIDNPAGLTDILRRLETVAAESTLRQAAVAGARVVHGEILRRAPLGKKAHKRSGKLYPPGTLRKAILIAYDQDESLEGVRAVYLVGIARDAFYWQFKERGTSHQAKEPFFRPGYDASKNAAAAAMLAVIDRKVAAAIRGI